MVFGIFISVVGFAQTDSTNKDKNEEIFIIVEQPPVFKEGMDSLYRWFSKTMIYPEIAKQNGNQGRVFVCFVIEKDGSITNIELLRRIEKSLNDEAIRIIKLMPKWKPGRKNGVPVRVKYTIPIDFKL